MAVYGAVAGTASSLLNKESSGGGGGTGLSKVINPFGWGKGKMSAKARVQRVFDPFGFFGGGDEDEVQPLPDYQGMSAGNLYDWASDYQDRYQYDPAKPYQGQMTAGLSGLQQQGIGSAEQYLGSQQPQSVEAAGKYATDVLGGKYDPRQSPYYTSMKSQILQDAQEAKAGIMHDSARAGMLHSDPHRDQERKLTEQTTRDLSSLIGSLYEAERGRMGEAAEMAPKIGLTQEQIPQSRIQTAMSTGAIPRQVEQQGLTAEMQEYLRQLQGAREPLNIFEGLSGKNFADFPAQPYVPGQQGAAASTTSSISQLLPLLMQMFQKK